MPRSRSLADLIQQNRSTPAAPTPAAPNFSAGAASGGGANTTSTVSHKSTSVKEAKEKAEKGLGIVKSLLGKQEPTPEAPAGPPVVTQTGGGIAEKDIIKIRKDFELKD
jgi:hypothetical protein